MTDPLAQDLAHRLIRGLENIRIQLRASDVGEVHLRMHPDVWDVLCRLPNKVYPVITPITAYAYNRDDADHGIVNLHGPFGFMNRPVVQDPEMRRRHGCEPPQRGLGWEQARREAAMEALTGNHYYAEIVMQV